MIGKGPSIPTATVSIDIQAPCDQIFDLIHDYERRLDWDPFLREALLLHEAMKAGLGISARCVAQRRVGGFAMETIYVSFNGPRAAAVKMTRGPIFLRSFAATLRHEAIGNGFTRTTYRFSFKARPRWLAFLFEPIVQRVLKRETQARLAALKRFLEADRGVA